MNLPPNVRDYIDNVLPKMEGWCTKEKAEALAEATLSNRVDVAVEIGVFAGRSLFAIGEALKFKNSGVVIGIDPWDPKDSITGFENDPANRDWWAQVPYSRIRGQCREILASRGLSDRVILLTGTARDVLPLFDRIIHEIDLLHIDGNHSEESALFDVNSYVPLVPSGGTVVFDDCDWSTTKKAQVRLHELCSLDKMVGNCGFFTKH